jgi:hypothetical protein
MMYSCEYSDTETEPCSVLYMHVCFGIFRIHVSGSVVSDFQVKYWSIYMICYGSVTVLRCQFFFTITVRAIICLFGVFRLNCYDTLNTLN